MSTQSILDDYLAGGARGSEFYETHFLNPAHIEERVRRASERRIHPVVLNVLREQNAPLGPEAAKSLKDLEDGAPAVLTGQQLGFLGGPLLTLYKIVGAISFARILEQKTGKKAVPIFWMQSEDHDFAEIAAANFLGDGESVTSAAIEEPGGVVGDSVGLLKLTKDIKDLGVRLGISSKEFDDALAAFKPGNTLDQAFGDLLKGLFSRYGLLVFSPLNSAIKTFSKDFAASSFFRAAGIERVLEDRAAWLKTKGYAIQVPIKERSPLFFVSEGQGRRRLVESADGTWVGGDIKLSKEELYSLIDEKPESFTTSALIRPVFQDFLFPTAAYIAGASEINYWAQATPLYAFFNIPQPLVVPRPRAALFEEKYQRIAEKAGASLLALDPSPTEFLGKRLAGSRFSPEAIFGAMAKKIETNLSEPKDIFLDIDPTLEKAINQTHESINSSIAKLRGRYEKSLAIKEDAVLKQYERLRRVRYPGGKDQEQTLAFMYFVGKYGSIFIESLLNGTAFEDFGRGRVMIVRNDGTLEECK